METTTRACRPVSSGQTRPPMRRQRQSPYFIFTQNGSKCGFPLRRSVNAPLCARKQKTWQLLGCIFDWRTGLKQRKNLTCDHGVLYFTASASPLLWAVTSAALREWHSSFVLESPHLIHGRLTPESEFALWPFRSPDSLILWFLRHWITRPFVCSVPGRWGASALCELLTCKTRQVTDPLMGRLPARSRRKVSGTAQHTCGRCRGTRSALRTARS